MQQKLDRIIYNKWLWIILQLLLIYYLCVTFGMFYESRDDAYIAFILSRPQNDFSPFQHDLLSNLLSLLYSRFALSWFSIVSVISILISSATISYVFFTTLPKRFYPVFFLLGAFVFYLAGGLILVNFTRTAGMVGLAGGFLLLYTVENYNGKLLRFFQIAFALILLILSSMIREDSLLLITGFLGITVVGRFISKYDISLSAFTVFFKKYSLCLLIPAVALLLPLTNELIITEEEKQFIDFGQSMSTIVDYPINYDEFDEQQFKDMFGDAYYEDVVSYVIDIARIDRDVFDNETVSQIASFIEQIPNVAYTDTLFHPAIRILLYPFLLFSLYAIITLPWRKKVFIVLQLVAFTAFVFYFTIQGRYLPRISDPVAISCLLSTLYICYCSNSKTGHSDKEFAIISKPGIAIVCALTVLFADIGINSIEPYVLTDDEKEDVVATLDAIHQDKEQIYVTPLHIMNYYAFDVLEPVPAGDYLSNAIILNGWASRTPYTEQAMQEIGVDNPMIALLENDKVVSFFDEAIYDYLKRHYSEDIMVSKIGNIGDHDIIKYTLPLTGVYDTLEVDTDINFEQPKFPLYADYVSGSIEDAEGIEFLFLNVERGEDLRSYRLDLLENGDFSANLYDPDYEYEIFKAPQLYDISLIAKMQDGKLLKIVVA